MKKEFGRSEVKYVTGCSKVEEANWPERIKEFKEQNSFSGSAKKIGDIDIFICP